MDPTAAARAAAEEALRRAHEAIDALGRLHIPAVDHAEWRGPASAAAAEELHELTRRLASCRASATQYRSAALRAVHHA